MKKWFTWILCLLILFGMTGCADSSKAVPELLEPVGVKINTATVQRDTIYTAQTFAGEIVPYVEELYFLTDGKLADIYVLPGERVEEGQVLAALDEEAIRDEIARLDNEAYEISTVGKYTDRQIEADISIAKVELEKLQAESAAEQECSEKESQIQQLELQLKQAQELRNIELGYKYSSIDSLRESLNTTKIIAPFTGRIVYVQNAKSGDAIQGFSTVLCIADETKLTVQIDFELEDTFTRADKLYAQVMDKAYDVTYLPYAQDEYLSMMLSGKDMKARFSIDAQPDELESGQFAAVMALYDYKENVLTIPVNALYRYQNGRHVYKLVDGQRIRCDVTVGVITKAKIEILDGLTEGDVICVND